MDAFRGAWHSGAAWPLRRNRVCDSSAGLCNRGRAVRPDQRGLPGRPAQRFPDGRGYDGFPLAGRWSLLPPAVLAGSELMTTICAARDDRTRRSDPGMTDLSIVIVTWNNERE